MKPISEAVPPMAAPQLGFPRMLAFGVGNVANSVKNRGLTTFLMVFYSQVMGLPPAWVGLGAGLALLFDAIVDPSIGWMSDHTRTRWGRRHPFMYAAALPMGGLFFLLWNPPDGLLPWQLFAFMMTCLIAIRFFDTFFELPSSALVPELIEDYDRRTLMFSIRILMGAVGSMLMMIFAYRIALREEPDGSGGVLAQDGYFTYGLVGAVVITAAILIATFSTHRYIPWLRQMADTDKRPPRASRLSEIRETLMRRSFLTIAASGMLVSFAGSLTLGLSMYITLYFWEFSQAQLSILAVAIGLGAIVGAGSATWFSIHLGKKKAAIVTYIIGSSAEMIPFILRFAGLMPDNGDPLVFVIVATGSFLNITAWATTGTLLTALVADVVEDAAVQTGYRSAGLLFSVDSLFKKVSGAGGPAVAGLLLGAVAFPVKAAPGEVPQEVLSNLMTFYLPLLVVIYAVSIAILARYDITRQSHAANIDKLRRARDQEEEPAPD